MAWNYSKKTVDLFMAAVHGEEGSHLGEITNPDGFGEHGSIACGDALRFTFRVKRHESDPTQDIITEAKYLTFGCTSAIAASEALCQIIEARQISPLEALKVTNQDIVDFLEGLPDQKIHCSVMGAEALEAAVINWAKNRQVDLGGYDLNLHGPDDNAEEGRLVCKCFSVTEPYLKRHIRDMNLRTIPEITAAIKAGGACQNCHHAPGGLQDALDEVWGAAPPPQREETSAPSPVSSYRRNKLIERCIEEKISPMLQRDGGDIEVVDIKGHLVYCQLQGACANCAGAAATLKQMVERTLKNEVDEELKVIAV
jgi:NifU-like protein